MIRDDVQRMLATEGLYLAFDPDQPNAIVPIVSQNGKLLSMRLDNELAPDRFLERCRLHGPFWPLETNLLPREAKP